MSDRKARLTVTLDPHLAAWAERLVEAGGAESVSAVVNAAVAERRRRDLGERADQLWAEAAERHDPAKVERMLASVRAQVERLPDSHRLR